MWCARRCSLAGRREKYETNHRCPHDLLFRSASFLGSPRLFLSFHSRNSPGGATMKHEKNRGWITIYESGVISNQYPPAAGASPDLRNANSTSRNRERSLVLFEFVLERESFKSTRSQIRSHVVPLAKASMRRALNSASSSLSSRQHGQQRIKMYSERRLTCSWRCSLPSLRCTLCKSCRCRSELSRSSLPSFRDLLLLVLRFPPPVSIAMSCKCATYISTRSEVDTLQQSIMRGA